MPSTLRHRLSLQRLMAHIRPPKRADYSDIYQDTVRLAGAHGRNFMGLGTPMQAQRRARERRERIWHRCLVIGSVIGIFAAGAVTGSNTSADKPTLKQRVTALRTVGIDRAPMLLPSDRRRCAVDWHEGCLVCVHRNSGGIFKTSMC